MSEASEIRRAKAGDQDAILAVLARHDGLMAIWCRKQAEPGFDEDDLRQEATLAALRAIEFFEPRLGGKFSSYLKECVRRHLYEWKTTRRNRPMIIDDDTIDVQAAHETVDHVWLQQAMDSLPARDRRVLELKFGLSGGGELGVNKIASQLCMSRATVRWILEKSKETIRRKAIEPEQPPAP